MPIIVSAYGDGNCAFNAFALGLCDLIVQGKLDADLNRQGKILQLFADANLNQNNWNDLKIYLINLKTSEKLIDLQKALAKPLRQLALNLILLQNSAFGEYTDNSLPMFQAAYDLYWKKDKKDREEDDIFRHHQFIRDKFEEIKDSNADPASTLENFWKHQGGAERFLQEMKKNGVYAGDLELSALCKFFEIEVYGARRGDMNTPLVGNKNNPSHFPAITLRNEVVHWNYEAELRPEWLNALVVSFPVAPPQVNLDIPKPPVQLPNNNSLPPVVPQVLSQQSKPKAEILNPVFYSFDNPGEVQNAKKITPESVKQFEQAQRVPVGKKVIFVYPANSSTASVAPDRRHNLGSATLGGVFESDGIHNHGIPTNSTASKEEIQHYIAQLYTYAAQGHLVVLPVHPLNGDPTKNPNAKFAFGGGVFKEFLTSEQYKILQDDLKKFYLFMGQYKADNNLRPDNAKYRSAFESGLQNTDRELFSAYQQDATTTLTLPEAKAIRKWEKFEAVEKIEKAVEKVFSGKNIEDIEKKGNTTLITTSTGKIEVTKTNNFYNVITQDNNKATLEIMVENTAKILDELQLPRVVDMKVPDEKIKQILIAAGKKLTPPLIINDKSPKREDTLPPQEPKKVEKDSAERKLVR